jgi:hypothetical protein
MTNGLATMTDSGKAFYAQDGFDGTFYVAGNYPTSAEAVAAGETFYTFSQTTENASRFVDDIGVVFTPAVTTSGSGPTGGARIPVTAHRLTQ